MLIRFRAILWEEEEEECGRGGGGGGGGAVGRSSRSLCCGGGCGVREAADAGSRCSPTEIFSVARKTRSGSAAFFRPFRPSRGISFSSLFFSLFSMSSLQPFFRLLSASFPLSFLSSVLSRQRLLTDSSRDGWLGWMVDQLARSPLRRSASCRLVRPPSSERKENEATRPTSSTAKAGWLPA